MAVNGKRPTLKDVAREAGLSLGMASRVLGSYGSYSATTEQRVRRAARKLDYRPNAAARSLKSQSTRFIGLLVDSFDGYFWTSLVRGIEDVARRARHNVILCNTDRSPKNEREYLETLLERNVDGIIVAPSVGHEHAFLKKVHRDGMPMVFVDWKVSGVNAPVVTIDNIGGAAAAVEHLIELGHRRIGLVAGLKGVPTSDERQAGYELALRRHGIHPDSRLVVHGDFLQHRGQSATEELLDLRSPPTALFVSNEIMFCGAIAALIARDIRFPEDISVAGFDDPIWASFTRPPLTCVSQPSHAMGSLACETLLGMIGPARGAPADRANLVLKASLVVRESCRRIG